ncbi:putative serine/threonine-protein kinase iks1 [Balamuthia mandrillaris]
MEYANQGTNLYDFVMNKRRSRDSTMDATKIQCLKQWRREQRRKNAPQGRDNNPLRDADGEYLNETLIWNFFLDILSGLSHLHAHNICHNDLKPQNLLLHDPLQASSLHSDPTERSTKVVEEGLTVVLTDFGSVKPILMSQASDHKEQIAKALERTGNTGTIEYMAPEVLLTDPLSGQYKHDYSEKSDVWSLGVILYFLCYSASPFASVNQETAPQQSGKDRIEDMEKEILSFRHLDSFPDTPKRAPVLKRLIEWMMNKDPQDRPTVDELVLYPPIRERLFSRMQASSAPSAKYSVPTSSSPNSAHTTALHQDAISASALILARPPTSMSVPTSPYDDETVVHDKHNQEPTSVTKDKNGNVLSLLTHQTTGESRLMVLTPKRRISNSTILNGLLWVIKSSPRRLFLQLDLVIAKQAFIAIFLFVKVMLLLERFEPAPTILLYCFIVLSALNILSCHKKRARCTLVLITFFLLLSSSSSSSSLGLPFCLTSTVL